MTSNIISTIWKTYISIPKEDRFPIGSNHGTRKSAVDFITLCLKPRIGKRHSQGFPKNSKIQLVRVDTVETIEEEI